ncbi:MAG: hypothetical protein PVH91_07370 [Pseudomonadales bacterium]|jgi:hypothetical protein
MTIVSFEHGFAFIKTRKVGGTSVEAALRAFTGEDDIVTALTPRDELHCARAGHDARNYARRRADEVRYRELVLAGQLDEALEFSRAMRKVYDSHMTARRLRRRLGRRTFGSLYRFTVERDPFSWLVSLAAYDSRAYHDGTLSEMDADVIRSRIAQRLARRDVLANANYGYYTIRTRLAVDRVLRYEDLEAELNSVLEHLGLAAQVQMPRLKENPQRVSLAEIYTPELETRVVERFRPVFELMRYPERAAGRTG